jgi:hypothetical protein
VGKHIYCDPGRQGAALPLAHAFRLLYMSAPLTQDFLNISYRSDLDLLVGRWLRPIELAEMQQGYQ